MKKVLVVAFAVVSTLLFGQSGGIPNLDQLKQALVGDAGGAKPLGASDTTPTAAPASVAEPSPTEQLQQLVDEKKLQQQIKAMKKSEGGPRRFASDLFDMRQLPGNVTEGGIADDYVLGIGDQLQVNAVGSVNFQVPAQVDGKGEVLIPKVGAVKVAGLTLGKARAAVRNKVVANFSRATVDLSVTDLRQVRVFILGEVYLPGGYLVPSLSSQVNVLSLAGGPKASGSFREIRVVRGGKVIHTLDLYPLRADGLGNMNYYLQSGDVVFVPLAFVPIMLEGSFVRVMAKDPDQQPPQIIKTDTTIEQAVGTPSVVLPDAVTPEQKAMQTIKKEQEAKAATPAREAKKEAKINAAVAALPIMQFELLPGEKASRALQFAGGLLPEAYQDILAIRRQDKDGLTTVTDLPIANLGTIEPKRGDVLSAYPRRDRVTRVISIMGWVRVEGSFARPDGLRVGDLLKRDNQILPDTYLGRGEIVRTLDDGSTKYLAFNVGKAIEGIASENLLLEDRDHIELFKRDRMRLAKVVRLTGPFTMQGEFPFHEGMRAADLVFQAGVPDKSANQYYGELARSRYGKPSQVFHLDLDKLISTEASSPVDFKDDKVNPLLQEDDHISV